MTMQRPALSSLTFGMLAILMLVGCGRTLPSRFYMLTPGVQEGSPKPKIPEGVTIGVGPVALPYYLDRPNIVTRVGPNQVAFSEFEKWAGSLKEDIPRVLAENLSRMLNTDRIELFPWSVNADVSVQLRVDIIAMDVAPDQDAVLQARWSMIDGESGRIVHLRKSEIRKTVSGDGYPQMVAALGETLDALCREMAPEIRKASAIRSEH